MTNKTIQTLVASLCGSLLLAGCPDDPIGNETEGSTGSETTTTTNPVTVTAGVTVGMTSSSSSGEDTTVGVDETTGSTTVDDTTTGDETTTGDDTTTGDPPGNGYGDCANNPEAVACESGEVCLDGGNVAVCALLGCMDAGDCPVPATGDAVVSCEVVEAPGLCYLECSAGQACPDGMICADEFLCAWQTIAPGGGMCPDLDIGGAVPQMLMGDNTGLFDDHIPSCVAGGGEDALYQFTAPEAGTYVFDTVGSSFDTALAVLDGCGGPELACNDDFGMQLTSRITIALAAGQSIIVVVDSYDGEVGPFNLNVSMAVPSMCPDQDIGSAVPQLLMGDNTGSADDHAPTCAPGGSDVLYQFTAPAANTYVFSTAGSVFDTVLAVLDGCGGAELDCNDDFGMSFTSQITLPLAAGQSVIIVVDGYDGEVGGFSLNVGTL